MHHRVFTQTGHTIFPFHPQSKRERAIFGPVSHHSPSVIYRLRKTRTSYVRVKVLSLYNKLVHCLIDKYVHNSCPPPLAPRILHTLHGAVRREQTCEGGTGGGLTGRTRGPEERSR